MKILWIWHWFVGAPGSYYDLNVLSESPLFDAVQSSTWPPSDHRYTVNGHERSLLYYLADGMYPLYPFLVSPYAAPETRKERTFNRPQEAVRKDVERLFAVVTSRFHIALHPARYRTVEQLNTTSKAIAILHNMIVERSTSHILDRGGDRGIASHFAHRSSLRRCPAPRVLRRRVAPHRLQNDRQRGHHQYAAAAVSAAAVQAAAPTEGSSCNCWPPPSRRTDGAARRPMDGPSLPLPCPTEG